MFGTYRFTVPPGVLEAKHVEPPYLSKNGRDQYKLSVKLK
ncbi:hypothetical protein J5U21_02957 [Saccharolobus shibatae]|uniref:Uncharacterized protein n=1 Tax=Saccharolobus shibatae TaxID=2286 RepID=A0A8F5GXM0_9CREN|nr:hypothetical protein J5U21_02957 [Saccharolobus shibatae]